MIYDHIKNIGLYKGLTPAAEAIWRCSDQDGMLSQKARLNRSTQIENI